MRASEARRPTPLLKKSLERAEDNRLPAASQGEHLGVKISGRTKVDRGPAGRSAIGLRKQHEEIVVGLGGARVRRQNLAWRRPTASLSIGEIYSIFLTTLISRAPALALTIEADPTDRDQTASDRDDR